MAVVSDAVSFGNLGADVVAPMRLFTEVPLDLVHESAAAALSLVPREAQLSPSGPPDHVHVFPDGHYKDDVAAWSFVVVTQRFSLVDAWWRIRLHGFRFWRRCSSWP